MKEFQPIQNKMVKLTSRFQTLNHIIKDYCMQLLRKFWPDPKIHGDTKPLKSAKIRILKNCSPNYNILLNFWVTTKLGSIFTSIHMGKTSLTNLNPSQLSWACFSIIPFTLKNLKPDPSLSIRIDYCKHEPQ